MHYQCLMSNLTYIIKNAFGALTLRVATGLLSSRILE
jgi:hypothetical protein